MDHNLSFLKSLLFSATIHGAALGGIGVVAFQHADIAFVDSVTGTSMSAVVVPVSFVENFEVTTSSHVNGVSDSAEIGVEDNRETSSTVDENEALILMSKLADAPEKPVVEPKREVAKASSAHRKSKSLETIKAKARSEAVLEGKSQESAGMGENKASKWSLVYAPKPPYPVKALKMGFEGRVELGIDIDQNGSVSDGAVLASSGRYDCDQAALKTVLKSWRFSPATVNGIPVPSKEKVVVIYSLKNLS